MRETENKEREGLGHRMSEVANRGGGGVVGEVERKSVKVTRMRRKEKKEREGEE